jgi:hypothetical protein
VGAGQAVSRGPRASSAARSRRPHADPGGRP